MEAPRRRMPAALLVLLGAYLVLATVAFFFLFDRNDTDDFAGWVPAFVVIQILWGALVGVTPRPTARVGARAGLAAAIAAVLVFCAGLGSFLSPLELLELSWKDGEKVVPIAGVVICVLVLVATMVTAQRFARTLASVSARGVAGVLLVVGGTGLWALAIGLTVAPVLPHRPWGILDGIVTYGAIAAGLGALGFSLPLFVYAWSLRQRPVVDTPTPSP